MRILFTSLLLFLVHAPAYAQYGSGENIPFCEQQQDVETYTRDYTYSTRRYHYVYNATTNRILSYSYYLNDTLTSLTEYCYDEKPTLIQYRRYNVIDGQQFLLSADTYYERDSSRSSYGKILYRVTFDSSGAARYSYDYRYAENGEVLNLTRFVYKNSEDPYSYNNSSNPVPYKDYRIHYAIDSARGDFRKILYREEYDAGGMLESAREFKYSDEGYLEQEIQFRKHPEQDNTSNWSPGQDPDEQYVRLVVRKESWFGSYRTSPDFRKEVYVTLYDSYGNPTYASERRYDYVIGEDYQQTGQSALSQVLTYRFMQDLEQNYYSYPEGPKFKRTISTVRYYGTYKNGRDFQKTLAYLRFDQYEVPQSSNTYYYSEQGLLEKTVYSQYVLDQYYPYDPYATNYYGVDKFWLSVDDDKRYLYINGLRFEEYTSSVTRYGVFTSTSGSQFSSVVENTRYNQYGAPQYTLEYIRDESGKLNAYYQYRYEEYIEDGNPYPQYRKVISYEWHASS